MGGTSSHEIGQSDCHEQKRNVTTEHTSNSAWTPGQEKRYDPLDKTFTFIDREDEHDFKCDDFKSLKAKMSCRHTVTPMSLTKWCCRQLDEGKRTFVCGVCDDEWSYKEVCKMALLTPEERKEFEKKMFKNAAKVMDVKECPGCKSLVMRIDLQDLSVKCTKCTAKNGRYIFCWQCLKEWKGPAPRSDRCGNDGCINPALEILRKCPDIVFESVRNVTGCPTIRACPTCGVLIEHDKTKCKNVVCQRCEVEFCFVCLKITKECQKITPHSYDKVCSTGVAPRQTTIPVWKRK